MTSKMARGALLTAVAAAALAWSVAAPAKPMYLNPLDPRFDYHPYVAVDAPGAGSAASAMGSAQTNPLHVSDSYPNPLHPGFDYHRQVSASVTAHAAPPVAETNPLHPRFNRATHGRPAGDASAQRDSDALTLAATRRLLDTYEGAAYEYRLEGNPLHPRYDFHRHIAPAAAAETTAIDLALTPLHPRYYSERSNYSGPAPATYTAATIPLSPLDPRYSLRVH